MARAVVAAVMSVEPGMCVAAVVEDAVEYQPHAFTLRVVPQAQQRIVTAKLRIHFPVIFGIVLVHARRGEDRIQVQRGYAQRLEVRQLLADTVKIAAVEGRAAGFGGQWFIPVAQDNVVPGGMMVIDLVLLLAALLATRETVGEDLVENLLAYPLRAVIRAVD